MLDTILKFLQTYKYKTISIDKLEKLFSGDVAYEDFARQITEMVENGMLHAVKAQGVNHKPIPLANVYRINKAMLQQELIDEIKSYQFQLHPQIMLNDYFTLTEEQWKKDLPYIRKINSYLRENGLPRETATIPERSYQLSGDEKWIDEKGGKQILERLGLWKYMQIITVPDPLMLAVNPAAFEQEPFGHLIVENKAPYNSLMDALRAGGFLSLIYGAGWKIVSNIAMLENQLNLPDRQHRILYFGDIDYEGISIWYALNQKRPVIPAVEFYTALLDRGFSRGKETQGKNEAALSSFLQYFADEEQKHIISTLNNGAYYPQEGLSKTEMQEIWRRVSCIWT